MKRVGIIVLCLVILVGLLSGWSLFKKKSAKGREITVWSFAANNIEEWKARKADIEQKFDIKLNIVQVAQDAFVQKLQAVMMDGKGVPDIIEWMIENNRILNADPNKSFVLPLDKYTKKSSVFGKVVKGRVSWVTYGGHVYGLPHDVHPVVLVYNDTVWKSAGVDVAKLDTWDDFFKAGEKLIAKKKDGKPINYPLPYGNDGLNNTMFMIWQQTGAQVLDRNGKPQLDSPEFAAFVKKWLEWDKLGEFTAWDWGNFQALVADGTIASYTSPDWWIPQVNQGAKEGKYQYRVRALPSYKKGGPQTCSWGGTFLAMPKGTDDPEFVYQIMEYAQYDPSAIKTRYKTTDMLPPLQEVWGDDIFKQPDQRFGGQKLGELQTTLAPKMPQVNTGDIFWDAILTDFGQQYSEMATGKVTVEEGLKKAQAAAMKRYEQLK